NGRRSPRSRSDWPGTCAGVRAIRPSIDRFRRPDAWIHCESISVATEVARRRVEDAARRRAVDAARRLHGPLRVAQLRDVAGDALSEPVGTGCAAWDRGAP